MEQPSWNFTAEFLRNAKFGLFGIFTCSSTVLSAY